MIKPNILWYCTDQQRFDTIHALGNTVIHTPRLDAFISSGVAFTKTYTQSPICTPSRASFLTGRYPASHHVYRNGNERFPKNETLVTKMFSDAGYDCGLVGKLHLAGSQYEREARSDDGYRYYQWSHHPYPNIKGNLYIDWLRNEKHQDVDKLFSNIKGSYGIGLPEELHQTTWCTEKALEFITEKRDTPWLLSINPFGPHPTFHPPKEYLDRYDVKQIPYPLFRETDIIRQKVFQNIDQQTVYAVDPYKLLESGVPENSIPSLDLPKDQMASIAPTVYDPRLMKACYYAEIELIDTQFGRMIDTLSESGQLENTIVIFTSDHGELLGDHGLLFKGCRFFESLVHVPLIISWPKQWKSNIKSTALVELIDIAPTLLEAAGLQIPYYMQGKSLLGLLEGRVNPHTHKDYVICEYNDAMGQGSTANFYNASHGTMYYDGRYKIIVYHGQDIGELYDHKQDPNEFDNLWDSEAHQFLKCTLLKRHFDAMMKASSPGIRRTKEY